MKSISNYSIVTAAPSSAMFSKPSTNARSRPPKPPTNWISHPLGSMSLPATMATAPRLPPTCRTLQTLLKKPRNRTEVHHVNRSRDGYANKCGQDARGWKETAEFSCQFVNKDHSVRVRYNFPVSRSGKSSSELSSLMVRNPMVGNSLEHRVGLYRTSINE